MLKQTVILLVGVLAIASAFNAILENNLLQVTMGNGLSYNLFQTRGGIIAHDYFGPVLQVQETYLLINLQTQNVSVILSDIVAACASAPSNFDRLHYHVTTSTLLYYCSKNNSLLILDEEAYTVKLTIPTNVNATFDDVKLVSQGYSIAILGMAGAFTQAPEASQLITINLQTQAVANHVVFSHSLNAGEVVVGYSASSKNELYILTSSQTAGYQVTLYSMFLIGNSYSITNLTTFSYKVTDMYFTFPELYAVGTLVVVSYNQTLAVISSQGNVLGTVQDLAAKPVTSDYSQQVALAIEYGSSDFYALLANTTLLKYTVQNGGYKVETWASNIADMQYVTSNMSSNSLLFTINGDSPNYLFNITDLQTSQPIYTTFPSATNFMVTDTTYATLTITDQEIYIFNRETNLLIYQNPIAYNYYYDGNSHLISYMDYTNSTKSQCQMVQFDLQTLKSYIPFILDPSYGTDCTQYTFLNVVNDDDTPEFILDAGNNLLIMSKSLGLAQYGSYNFGDYNFPYVDYDTMTVSIAVVKVPVTAQLEIRVSTYNPNTQSFIYQNTTPENNVTVGNYYAGPGIFLVPSAIRVDPVLEFINMTTLDRTVVPYSEGMWDVSFFQDKTGAVYTVLGDLRTANYIYYDNQFTVLTGGTNNTLAAFSAGQCRYSVTNTVEGYQDFITVVSFYNVCSKSYLVEDIIA